MTLINPIVIIIAIPIDTTKIILNLETAPAVAESIWPPNMCKSGSAIIFICRMLAQQLNSSQKILISHFIRKYLKIKDKKLFFFIALVTFEYNL